MEKNYLFFDTHVHINAEQFNEDVHEVVLRAREAGVQQMVIVGFDRPTIDRALQLAESDPDLYACIGFHPVESIHVTDEDLLWLEEKLVHPKVVALGETGLDYYWDTSPKDVQSEIFRQHIRLAKKKQLPIVIHNREATEDVIRILQEENAKEVGGILHCFTGSVETAHMAIEMNFYISLGGPVTYKNAVKPKEVAEKIPLEHLLIETDCPYLPPHPHRGKRNEPAYVVLVAEEIARIKNITVEEVAHQTHINATRLFFSKNK